MNATIITIGDEILIGQIVDTNSAWLAQQLNFLGIKVHQIVSISDDENHIVTTLSQIQSDVKLVILTGGLGPTKDDITKKTLVKFFETKLVKNQEVENKIVSYFLHRGATPNKVNLYQALLPENAKILPNNNGTASGMWFEKNNTVFVSLPGVPYEMKAIVTDFLLPELSKKFNLPVIVHKTIMTQGIGESNLMEIIADWENSLKTYNIKLAYLPKPGMVRLRLSGMGLKEENIETRINKKIEELQKLIPQFIYGYDEETLQEVVGKLLQQNNFTLCTAESCTGGYLAHLITSISGSSNYYIGSVISYSNQIKQQELGVTDDDLKNYGAVSEQVVIQMAQGVKKKFKTHFAIATSGIAGPTGGTKEKPVGTVWIAVAGPKQTITKKFIFGHNRERNITISALTALMMLRRELLSI